MPTCRHRLIFPSYPCGSGSNWCLPLKSTISKTKNWKIPIIKTPLSMCLSQIIKIVLIMLISGILLSEKHPKTYQLGLGWSTKVWDIIVKGTRSLILTPKRYDTSILTHFRFSPISDFPPRPRQKPKNLRSRRTRTQIWLKCGRLAMKYFKFVRWTPTSFLNLFSFFALKADPQIWE